MSSAVTVELDALWLPKQGNGEHEWEDGVALSEGRRLFGLADGASSSPRSGAWATSLVEAWITASGDRQR